MQNEWSGERLWPVHRLDKVTSGLLLLARNKQACSELGDLFKNSLITKTYLAIARGKPQKKQGTIVGDMERSRRGSWKLLRAKNNPAITRFESTSIKPNLRLYALKPQTGKTHQLRVAMKALGVPILGDTLYAGEKADRVYLHAYSLLFNYKNRRYEYMNIPDSGVEYHSAEFVDALTKLQMAETVTRSEKPMPDVDRA